MARSLATLAREHPSASGEMCLVARDLEILVDLGEGPFRIRVDSGAATVVPFGDGEASASVTCAPRTVLELLEGKLSLFEATMSGALRMAATPDVADRLERAFALYVAGAIRSPGFHDLLVRFRRTLALAG